METTYDTTRPIEHRQHHAPVLHETMRMERRAEQRIAYPAAAFKGPLFGLRDKIALVLATIMMLGPLAALPLGFGG